MKRRQFLKIAGGGMALSPWLEPGGIAAKGSAATGGVLGNSTDADIRSLFEANGEEVMALAETVFRKCILDKLRPPVEPLRHTWVQPGGPYYMGQWIWDTMFVVDLLSILPGQKQVIRDIFQNYWDFQDRWNKKMPDYAHDMITVAIKTAPQEERQFSQIPILAWGVERVYQRNGDKELLKQCLGRLERFHDWYWRERDLHDNGLVTLGAYTGKLQHAKWETFDYECNMDGMTMTVHPKRKGPNEGAWYADICVPGNTAYLIMGERSLARLAEIAGDKAMAARRRRRIEKGVKAMREHMWDEAGGHVPLRQARHPREDPGRHHRQLDSAGRRRAHRSDGQAHGRSAGLAGLADAAARADRGPHGQAVEVQTPSGAATSGRRPTTRSPAAWPPMATRTSPPTSADKTIANAIKNGISEHYDSVTGKPLGVPDYCMSCTLVTMMLDGLATDYRLKVRRDSPERQKER